MTMKMGIYPLRNCHTPTLFYSCGSTLLMTAFCLFGMEIVRITEVKHGTIL